MTRTLTRRPGGMLLLLVVFAALLAGCGGDQGLEIAGTYLDQYGSPHVITDTTWDSSSDPYVLVFNIAEYSNATNVLLARNGSTNSFNADLYSRFTWTVFAGERYFCQDPYDAATLDDARNAAPPDASNPPAAGCGFTWSRLIPQ